MATTVSEPVHARKGFFPLVMGHDVHVQEAGGVAYLAKGNLSLSRGGGQWLIAGREQTVVQGGGAMMLTRQARVTNGFIGVLIAGQVTLEGNARALLRVSLPVAAAAAAGFVLGGLASRFSRREPRV